MVVLCLLLTLVCATSPLDGQLGPGAVHLVAQKGASAPHADGVRKVGAEDSLIAAAVVRFIGKNVGKETVKKVI